MFFLNQGTLKAQEPIILDSKMKPGIYNDMRIEELKVRWKKAALENCPGVPCVTAPSFTCGTSTVPDMDGNSYNTVSIGTQCWLKENLKVTKYNDGILIPIDATAGSGGGPSTIWQNLTTGAYTIFGNESSTGTNATNYGFLYNWYAVKGISTVGSTTYKNLCPTGWHVPIDGDLTSLETQLGGSSVAGGKLKSTSLLWSSGTPGTNISGFTGLPGGYRGNLGYFSDDRYSAFFWSATEIDGLNARYRYLDYGSSGVYPNYGPPNSLKSSGYSVRCLRD
jgi:uncharacterized protein (TIGR02145 family)